MDYVPSTSSSSSAVAQVIQAKPDFFVVESIISHSFSRSTRNKPDGIHNITLEVKWQGYDDTSFEILAKNFSLQKTTAVATYFRNTPTLQHLCVELPVITTL
jgi:hypothetical protein